MIRLRVGVSAGTRARVARELPLHLNDVTAYKSGMVELWYELRQGSGA